MDQNNFYVFDTYSSRLRQTLDELATLGLTRSQVRQRVEYKIRRDNLVSFTKRCLWRYKCLAAFLASGGSFQELEDLILRLFSETKDYCFSLEYDFLAARVTTLPRAERAVQAYHTWVAAMQAAHNNNSGSSDQDTDEEGGTTIV